MKKSFRTLIVVAVFTSLAISLIAASKAHAEYLPSSESQQHNVSSFEKVRGYLKSDHFILSRLELRKLSADPLADVIRLAKSSKTATRARARAIQCLALYRDDPRASKAVEKLLTRIGTHHRLFPAALMTYAQIAGEDSVPLVSSYLKYRKNSVRMTAVVALGRFGGDAGAECLARRAQVEKNAQIRARIRGYLQ